ncbi:MAG TPA: S41 family peptidase, partial [Vampirovibrionales bacterium]
RAIDAKLPGIGIQIGLDNTQKVIVIAPIHGTPAFKAGLMPKDEIVEVDGTPTKGLSIEEVANKIRGTPGTAVKLLISRDSKEQTFEITRAEIHLESVPKGQATKINDKVCYIRLTSFIAKDAAKEFTDELNGLGNCPGLIMDLRSNPGGLLDNAISLANVFLDNGMDIVSTVDRDGYVLTKSTDKDRLFRYKGNLLILVNEGSASASEILSGALKDHGVARLVGDKTFGKGLVQLVRDLPDGSGLNITMAKYLTPNGTDINKIGIEPNIKVELTKDELKEKQGPWFNDFDNIAEPEKVIKNSKDLQLLKAIEVLNDELAKAAAKPKEDSLKKKTVSSNKEKVKQETKS